MRASRSTLVFNLVALATVVAMTAKTGFDWSFLWEVGVALLAMGVVLYLSQRQGVELERRLSARRLARARTIEAHRAAAARAAASPTT